MDSEKMFTFLRGVATGLDLKDTLIALNLARRLHKGQMRKDGVTPYLAHPLTLACNAVALGIKDDNILASCLLHDIIEDCEINENNLKDYGLSQVTVNIVSKLTKKEILGCSKYNSTKNYYDWLSSNPKAMFVKVLDRCHNISTMAGVFSKEKMEEYCQETIEFVFPLMDKLKECSPEYSNMIFVLKYHITSVLDVCNVVIGNTGNENKEVAKNV